MPNVKISPSILAADFAKLGQEVKDITQADADLIHLDIMDGHFVPNITFGPQVAASIRKHTSLPLDAHLMITDPDRYIKAFVDAGADIITVHYEACMHLDRTIDLVKSYGKKVGVALVPATLPSVLEYVLDKIDHVLVMSVNPGFCGQRFIDSQLDKIKQLRLMKKDLEIMVDGGVNQDNASSIIAAGANTLVAGSSIFIAEPEEYGVVIKQLKNQSRKTLR
jgi:ribulose-phosphate 3-epimerase